MRIHAIQTGTVAIKTRQVSGRGRGALWPYITLLWCLVEGRPGGEAIARRKRRAHEARAAL